MSSIYPSCESWIGIDDMGGEGEETFEHECGRPNRHEGKHQCMGHPDEWSDTWGQCHQQW